MFVLVYFDYRFYQVLNFKLELNQAEISQSLTLPFILGEFVLLCAWVFIYVTTAYSRPLIESSAVPVQNIASLGIIASYFAMREVFQFHTFSRIGLAWSFLSNFWNLVDVFSIVLTFVVISMAGGRQEVRASIDFRIVAAVGNIFLWTKVLGYVKVFNQKLAAYVYALEQIVVDLTWFLMIMFVVVIMFACK